MPLDEVTWQTADGDGPGNWCGLSLSMSTYGEPGDRLDRAIAIAADFMGRCAARFAIVRPEQRRSFDPPHTDLPYLLHHDTVRGRSAWTVYAERWNAPGWTKGSRWRERNRPDVKPEPFAITWNRDDVLPVTFGRDGGVTAWPLLGRITALRSIPIFQGATVRSLKVHSARQGKRFTIRAPCGPTTVPGRGGTSSNTHRVKWAGRGRRGGRKSIRCHR